MLLHCLSVIPRDNAVSRQKRRRYELLDPSIVADVYLPPTNMSQVDGCSHICISIQLAQTSHILYSIPFPVPHFISFITKNAHLIQSNIQLLNKLELAVSVLPGRAQCGQRSKIKISLRSPCSLPLNGLVGLSSCVFEWLD